MATQITKNNHYIPRSLTRPWEGSGRRLTLYNFDTNAFEPADSKTCFSPDEAYPKEIETFLHDVIEKPMHDMLQLLQKGEEVLQQERYHRAATLLVVLQRTRSRSTTDAAFLKVLIELAEKPKKALDGLGVEHGYGVSIVRARQGARPLFFPSTGNFVLLGNDLQLNGKPIAAWGIPLDPERALVFFNLKADASSTEEIRSAVEQACPALLEQASIGTDTSTKVVIPPALKDAEDTLVSLLGEARRANRQAIIDYNARVSAASKAGSEN
jgi:hypothetical protein